MATDTKTLTVHFTKERDTKNTVRFQEVVGEGEPELIGTLYVQKFATSQMGSPDSLVMTLSPA